MKNNKKTGEDAVTSYPVPNFKNSLINILSKSVDNSIRRRVSTYLTETEFMLLLKKADRMNLPLDSLVKNIFEEGLRSYGL